jgi:NADH-quinone oxidoreductase subunit N
MSWVDTLIALLPENLLLAGIVLTLGFEIALPTRRNAGLLLSVLAVTLAAAAAACLSVNGFAFVAFAGHYSVDPTALLAKAIVLGLAVPVLLIARLEAGGGAFFALILSSLYGICLLLSADSFLTLFLGIELMSLPVYALVVIAVPRRESAEAALKYLVLGGTATATLLMGVSLLYGSSGSFALSAFGEALDSGGAMAAAAVVLIVVGFFVKAAIVPFHGWAPDAYEAAAVPVTAYMATIIKAGVLLAALRLFGTAPLSAPMVGVLSILPLLSIVWGNLTAMRQQSFRRMIAYSSIAHAGYLFYAFLGDGAGRFQAVAFYVVVYGLMNVLAFASLPRADDDATRDRLDNLKGLFRRRPYAAAMIAFAMVSLAGIPPFPGFVAKFLIFRNVFAAGYTVYAVLGLIGSYLGIYFYLRVIQYLFMSTDEPAVEPRGAGRLAFGASFICLLLVVAISLFPGWVIDQF